MCRILLIIKKNFDIKILLHFLEQSIKIKNTPGLDSDKDADYHLDGYGITWFENNNWSIYKNKKEPSKDYNLEIILKLIPKNIVIGHLRAICKKSKSISTYFNSHPFSYKNNIWCHNGCVCDFQKQKSLFNTIISKKYHNYILGTTDSEYLFYTFLSLYDTCKINNSYNKLHKSIIDFFTFIKLLNGNTTANIIFANEEYIWISRIYIIQQNDKNKNDEPSSLYYDIQNKNIIISSEPVTENYKIFPKNNIWIINIKTKKINKLNIE